MAHHAVSFSEFSTATTASSSAFAATFLFDFSARLSRVRVLVVLLCQMQPAFSKVYIGLFLLMH